MLTWDKAVSGLILALLAYIISDVSTIKTDVAVSKVKIEHVEEKVADNHEMITPMWQEFLTEKQKNVALVNASSD